MPYMKLTEDQKLFIIVQFAKYLPPQRVCDKVKEEFGIDLERSHAQHYNPLSAHGKKLSRRYKEFFVAARDSFKAGQFDAALSERESRLAILSEIAEEARAAGNLKMALRAIEQAAKERGDVYTNKTQTTFQGEVSNTYTLTGGLPDVPLGEVEPSERDRVVAESRMPREVKDPGATVEGEPRGFKPPNMIPELVTADQISPTASPEERAAWEARQEAKREAAMGLPPEPVHPSDTPVQSIAIEPSTDQP